MNLDNPVPVFTAKTNIEAIQIAALLVSKGIPAFAMEDDHSFSTLPGTVHKPDVYVEEQLKEKALLLIHQLEEERVAQTRAAELVDGPIKVHCEECNRSSTFAKSLNGTTQECPHCHAYVDVGDLPWEEDWGVPED
ncbi:MAG: hypothetical protein VX768_18030 [Planctomycetota bacterium]|nr:hypothetical protein [Planctomycetota bacterium]